MKKLGASAQACNAAPEMMRSADMDFLGSLDDNFMPEMETATAEVHNI